MTSKKTARKSTTTKRQKGGEPQKGLIITTGDASDFDGFMALPLYYKAAKKHNMDVMFIMNFPAYFSNEFNTQDKAQDKAQDVKTERNLEVLKDNKGEAIKYALPIGLGFNYGHDVFCRVQNYRDESGALNMQKFAYLKNIESEIIKKHGKNIDVDMDTMSFITYRIVMEIWDWCASTFGGGPELKFCKGGINSVNPFSVNQIKNEFEVYGPVIANSLLETDKLKTAISDYFTEINANKIVDICKNAKNIYIDMNGSMAWYNAIIRNEFENKELKDKVQGVFVMGGVLSYSQVNTMGAGPTLNRLSCATMNQLYHAKNTGAFFKTYNDKLYFITNNEINANFTYLTENRIYPQKQTYAYDSFQDSFQDRMSNLNLIPNDKEHKVFQLFDAFYKKRPGDRKPFDVISALALVQFIDKNGQIYLPLINNETDNRKLPLIYDDTYGITILGPMGEDKQFGSELYYDKKQLDLEKEFVKKIIGNQATKTIGNVNVLYASKHYNKDRTDREGKVIETHDNAYEHAILQYMENTKVSLAFTANEFAWPINSITHPQKPGGGGTKIYILGRSRKIIPKGRYQYIMYNKEHITINAARKLELKRQKSKKVVARK
jgi:hypothetical protein